MPPEADDLQVENSPKESAPPVTPSPPLRRRLVRACAGVYFWAIVGVWALIEIGGDGWWVGTAVMFAPKWVWLLPLILLVPAAALFHRKSLVALTISAVVILFPMGRFCVPWRMALPSQEGGSAQLPLKLRVVTLNADHKDLHPDDLARLVNDLHPDLVVLQAWRSRYEAKVFAEGWHLHRDDELCLASRFPIASSRRFDGDKFPAFKNHPGTLALYQVGTPTTPLHVVNLHLATPRDGLAALLHRALRDGANDLANNSRARLEQSRTARDIANALPGPVIVAGDFNTPTTSSIYRECWSDRVNAFSTAGWGWGHTHFTPHTGVRIDHVLVGREGWAVDACYVGPDVGSAHRPVIADVTWTAPLR
jgi:vancomycin resistance protein VanJ